MPRLLHHISVRYQHGKHRKTNRDKAMVRTAFLSRYIPLRLSI